LNEGIEREYIMLIGMEKIILKYNCPKCNFVYDRLLIKLVAKLSDMNTSIPQCPECKEDMYMDMTVEIPCEESHA
jgi:hypothetical protein